MPEWKEVKLSNGQVVKIRGLNLADADKFQEETKTDIMGYAVAPSKLIRYICRNCVQGLEDADELPLGIAIEIGSKVLEITGLGAARGPFREGGISTPPPQPEEQSSTTS